MWIISWACRSRKVWSRTRNKRVADALVKAGLPVHPATCSLGGETLGWDFDPERPVVGVSRRGLWRLRTAMLHVASRGWASEDEISSLVGRFTVRRELLTTFSAAYAFSHSRGRQGRRLRVPVLRELRVAASLIFQAHRDLSAPRCPEVSLFDASPWSGAVVTALVPATVESRAAVTIAGGFPADRISMQSSVQ